MSNQNLPQPIINRLDNGTLSIWREGCAYAFTVTGAEGRGTTRILWREYADRYILDINAPDYLADEAQLETFSNVVFQLGKEIGCDIYLEHKKQNRTVFDNTALQLMSSHSTYLKKIEADRIAAKERAARGVAQAA